MAGDQSQWQRMRLGEAVKITHGWPFKSAAFTEERKGRPIVVSIGNFKYTGGFRFDSSTVKEYTDVYPKAYELRHGDILLVMTCQTPGGEILGIPGSIPNDGRTYLHNQRLGKVVVTQPNRICPGFIYYLALWSTFNRHLCATASGTKIVHTAPSRIEAFEFAAPTLPEQKRIAYILGTLDDKIELNRRMNATLEGISRAIFKSWFVDFDPVRQKAAGKQPVGMDAQTAALFPDSFENSEIGEVPKGWRAGTMGDCVDVVDCLHTKKPERVECGKPLLQLANIRDDGLLDMADTFLISDDNYRKWSVKFETQVGDCVITNVGRVGAVSQIPPGVSAALGRNMTGLRPKRAFPFPTFLIECLLSASMREEIERKTDSGTILNALNVKSIPRLRLPIPHDSVAAAFERSTRPLRCAMEDRLKESRTLAALRDTLLPKLLSGEVRVPKAEDAVEEAVA